MVGALKAKERVFVINNNFDQLFKIFHFETFQLKTKKVVHVTTFDICDITWHFVTSLDIL
jgi:hypothetical protein